MNGDCYMFLLPWKSKIVNNKVAIAASIPKMMAGIVRGDSLEVPFVNFVRIQSISHNIGGFGSNAKMDYSDIAKLGRRYAEMEAKGNASWTPKFNSDYTAAYKTPDNAASSDWRWTGEPPMTEPGVLNGALPEQNHVSFTKKLDSATPQLAYGCTTQAQYKFALFYFRRKVAFNVASVQMPYMVLGLENVIIRDWSLDDDSETCKLSYDRICWGAVSQLADTPVPQGMTTRIFDRTSGAGGIADSSPLTIFVGVLTGVMYAAAWAAFSAAGAANNEAVV